MVGFDAWQTPPAIEQKILRQNRDRWGGTTGGTQNGTNGEIPQEDEVESSTLTIRGKTSAGGKMIPETHGVKAPEDRPVREKVQTAAFSEFLFRRKTSELISLLNELKPNLQNPEGAAIMTSFRRSLEEIWDVAGRLPREKVIVVSAVEEAVRNTKWRELSVGQVDVLQRVLTNVVGDADSAKAKLDRAFRAIHGSQIDIYPSVADNFDDEAESDYDEE